MSENQYFIDGLPNLRIAGQRRIDGLEIVPLHDRAELALLAAVGRGINELQSKAEPQSQIVVLAKDLIDNEAIDVAGLAHEDDLFFRV
jgi:hypothetical protein